MLMPLLLGFAVVQSPSELLAEARAGHVATFASWRTLAFDCVFQNIGVPNAELRFFMRDGEERNESNVNRRDHVTVTIAKIDGKSYTFGEGRGGKRGLSISARSGGGLGDPLPHLLIRLPGAVHRRELLNELLENPHTLKEVARRKHDGREHIFISLSHEREDLEIWIDPAHNYLVSRCRMNHLKRPGTIRDARVESFLEIKPGAYFPVKVVFDVVENGKLLGQQIATVSDVRMNEELDPALFNVAQFYQPNTLVMDEPNKEQYEIDSAGRKVNAVFNEFQRVELVPRNPYAATAPTPLEPDPYPPVWVLVVAGLVLVLVTFLGWRFLHYRRQSGAGD